MTNKMPDETIWIDGDEVVNPEWGYENLEDFAQKYHHDRVVTALQEEVERLRGDNERLTKENRQRDIGDINYYNARKMVSELSGVPVMAVTFKEHVDVIKQALKGQDDE